MASLRILPLVLVAVWSAGHLSVNIQASAQRCMEGDVRLVGGSNYREGRVEVCRHQQWGKVCDDDWDKMDSAVVCRQLGLSIEGVVAVTASESQYGDSMLPFVLDNLGCNGTERNLLDCLPIHNCYTSSNENAGIICLRKGVALEHGSERLINNSLIILSELGEGSRALICATDRRECCTDESDHDGNWYMPSGSKITQQLENNTQALYINRSNQTIGLNYVNVNDDDVPSGIYYCEIADDSNVTNHLYVGIYQQNENMSITSLDYDNTTHTLVCISNGGPATTVMWSKDNSSRINDGQYYEQSVVIINTTTATYESRLRILNKSSKAMGNYTCTVSNSGGSSQKSRYLEVCRDMELRFNDGDSKNVEVCSSDQWHAVSNSAIVNNITLGNMTVTAYPTSVTIGFSSNDERVQGYDASCITTSNGQVYSVKVADVRRDVTMIQMNGLSQATNYECCITAYILTNIPIDTISLSCITVRTQSVMLQPPDTSQLNNTFYITGFWTILSICLLVLCVCVGSIIILFLLALKKQKKQPSRSTEKVYAEHMVVNPLYTDSRSVHESGEFRDRILSVAENPQYGTRTEVVHATYETISELPTRPRDTPRRSNNDQPGVDEPNANGLGNNLARQTDGVHSENGTATIQLYSTIPENYNQRELGSSEEATL